MAEKRTVADGMMRWGQGLTSTATVKDRRGALLRIWRYLLPDRWALLGIAGLVAVTNALSLLTPWLMGRAIDVYMKAGDLHGLARTVTVMAILYLLTVGGIWVQSVWMIRITQRAIRAIRRDLFTRLQTLPLRYFDRHPHGEVMSRVTNDTDIISTALGDSAVQLISSVLSVLGAGAIMFSMNWRLTLVSLAAFPLVLLATRAIGKATRQGFRNRQAALGTLNGLVEETIIGQRVVKVCRREAQAIAAFTEANEGLRRTAMPAVIAIGLMGPVMQVFRNIGFAVLIAGGIWMVIQGLATVGTLAAFTSYADFLNRPLMQLANLYGTIQSALAGAERVFAVLDETPEPPDAPDAVTLDPVRGDVTFDGVSFGYVPDTPVLTDVRFHAEAGQTIALVGSTGAGKTTIINLLTRFYDVDAGAIRIDGHDIRTLKRDDLRRLLGIVLQDTVLFAGTVRENIRFGRLDATDAEVEQAARLANADAFIRHLPHGYETPLTDAGNSLSQGQRQLLAIARAMLADPAILILDEATSSVDTRTEIHIQDAMHRLMHGRTSFIIAHRLSTVRTADRILVIDGGRVVEQGTHTELLAARGAYHRLYDSKMSSLARLAG
jgi:ATP-binding cassette subfamily B protein